MTDHPLEETVTCPSCGFVNKNRVTKCDTCGGPVELQHKYSIAECQRARHDLFAVPLKVTFRLFVYDKDPETANAHDARREGGGGLLRRHPADDRQRYVHHQRHRARHRQPAPPQPGRVLHQDDRGAYLPVEDHSRIVGPGSSSSTTRRTSCRCASTASGSSTARFSCVLWGSRTNESILRQFYLPIPLSVDGSEAALTIPPEIVRAGAD